MASASSSPPQQKTKRSQANRRAGQVIKTRWRIDGLLGVGGMAAVYAATDLRGRHAALKILHRAAAADPGACERFTREGLVGKKIKHPCMVAVFDEGKTELEEPFLIMEQLGGQSLERLWRRAKRRLPSPLVLRVMERVLDLLAACHEQGIIHRDLKPSNIFITSAGEVKVLDFGVARVRALGEERLAAGVAVGTPFFMAPEQAAGAWAQVDARADLFAVGATMYALLSGERLHQGKTAAESFRLAASSAAPSLATVAPDLDPALIALVDRSLAWDKHARYPDAEGMRQAVLEVLEKVDDGTSTLTSLLPHTREKQSLRAPSKHLPPSGRRQSTMPPPGGSDLDRLPLAPSLPQEFAATAAAEEAAPKLGKVLIDAFRPVEELLSSVLVQGFGHSELRSRLMAAQVLLSRALRLAGQRIDLQVFPFCITSGGATVWEPEPPLDAVPHALYSAGVRMLGLEPGLSIEDLRELVEVVLPNTAQVGLRDIDVLGLEQIPHIAIECVSMPMQGDGRARERFLQDTERIEAELRDALRRRTLSTSRPSLDPPPYSLKQAIRLERQEWSRRCAEVLVDAHEQSPDKGAEWLPLRAAAAHGRGRGYQAVFLLQAHVREALRDRFSSSISATALQGLMAEMLGDEDLKSLLQGASQLRAELLAGLQPWHEVTPDAVLQWVQDLLSNLGPDSFNTVLDAIPRLTEPGIELAAVAFLGKHASGRELRLALDLPKLRVRIAERILGILKSLDTPRAQAVILEVTNGSSSALRLLALAQLPKLNQAQHAEVLDMLSHADPEVRWAALKAAAAHELQDAAELAARRITSRSFHGLGLEERELLLDLLMTLEPQRGEQLAIDLVARHGLIGEQSQSESRVLAAELLGARCSSQAALNALRGASTPLWWNPPGVRLAATNAIVAVQARMAVTASRRTQ